MSAQNYVDNVLRQQWDDITRTYTEWDENGDLVVSTPEDPNPRPYTDAENQAADEAAAQQQAEAEAKTMVLQQQALLQASIALSAAAAPPAGSEWVQPTDATNAYPQGAQVTHNGSSWVSLVAFNVWEPGIANWREDDGSGCPEWVQPTGASDAYNAGDQAQYEGTCYVSLIDANVWSPEAYPAGWSAVA